MSQSLHDLIDAQNAKKFATDAGTAAHARMQRIVIDGDVSRGDAETVARVRNRADLMPFFCSHALTEVPVAGRIRGKFISRRIDRMVVNEADKTVLIMDYKTDVNPDNLRDAYYAQVREYMELVRQIYPGYSVRGYILWLYNFVLENV